MEKTYHFMAGLPRSGSTVLSALLNQHPDVYASPQTDLLEMLYSLNENIPNYQSYKAGVLHQGYESVVDSVADVFYSHINKPFVIDKNRGWGTPYNFDNISPYLNVDGKVILTLRPILEILASFIKVGRASEAATGFVPYLDSSLWASSYRNKTDAQVEALMKTNGEVERAILSVANLLKFHKDRVCVVWFDDFLKFPKNTMDCISDFLGIDRFDYNFESIKKVDKHNDLNGYEVAGLHDINTKLKNPATDPREYLSDYTIEKYKNALDFLQD